jgi:hypothetical protein
MAKKTPKLEQITIDKITYDHLKCVEKDYYSVFDYPTIKKLQEQVTGLQEKLTVENERCAQLDQETNLLARVLAGAADKIENQNATIDAFIEENLNLHHELILQRDCNRIAHEVVQLATELNKPEEKIDVPAGVSPMDALKFHQLALPNFLPEETHEPERQPVKRNYSRIAIALLIGAIIGLTIIVVHQNHVIQVQRHVMIDMLHFIQAGCPFSQLQ